MSPLNDTPVQGFDRRLQIFAELLKPNAFFKEFHEGAPHFYDYF